MWIGKGIDVVSLSSVQTREVRLDDQRKLVFSDIDIAVDPLPLPFGPIVGYYA
jgi:hypothetical protein